MTSDSHRPTVLETALRHDRVVLATVLVLIPLLSWAWIVVMARDMYGSMRGPAAWMMTLEWDWPHVFLLWAMWAVMMAAMMLPSAWPTLAIYGRLSRRDSAGRTLASPYLFAAGYLGVWALFSAAATVGQRALAEVLLLSPMMELTSPRAGAALLIVAGLYQLTPMKRVCLRACRSPMAVLLGRWRAGSLGAFRMGIDHGAYCVGCCWALMLLLFVGGVMNLYVIAALTLVVAGEKIAPVGEWGSRLGGGLLIALAVWLLVRG